MKPKELNQKELNELLGGEVEETASNNKNKNTIAGCSCKYYDGPTVVNKNNATPCVCECLLEPNTTNVGCNLM
jgi:hypothetical protein